MMFMTKYVAVANIIGDELVLPDGNQHASILGGAGTYAAAGMRIWSESVGIVSGVGEDFERLYGSWFDQNQVDKGGLQVRAPNTPRSWIHYFSADERTETPQFGPEHFKVMEPSIHDIPATYHDVRGLYLFRDTDTAFWDEVFAFRAEFHPIVMWEIHAGAAHADDWQRVAEILSCIDLFSINLSEARRLCQLTNPAQIVERLLATGVKGLALRSGSEGAIVADQNSVWQVPPCAVDVIDVTGAGNAFTGGFLVGYCESESDITIAGRWGVASASFALQQFGPPQEIDSTTRQQAETRIQSLMPAPVG
jgi:sugar/nucleoside kinase (ribokinase family)